MLRLSWGLAFFSPVFWVASPGNGWEGRDFCEVPEAGSSMLCSSRQPCFPISNVWLGQCCVFLGYWFGYLLLLDIVRGSERPKIAALSPSPTELRSDSIFFSPLAFLVSVVGFSSLVGLCSLSYIYFPFSLTQCCQSHCFGCLSSSCRTTKKALVPQRSLVITQMVVFYLL